MGGERTYFSTLGGHVALDFLNTRPMGADGPVEKLRTGADIAAWAAAMGLVKQRAHRAIEPADSDVKEFQALRESFRAALEAGGAKAKDDALARRINVAMKDQPVTQALIRLPQGGFRLERERRIRAPADLLAVVASEIALFLEAGNAQHSRRCEGEACVLWFLDETRNHSRHWCRMETCGARAKAKRYYQRRKTAAR